MESHFTITCGYCLVRVESSKDYYCLLNTRNLFLHGRRLITKPFLSGMALVKENRNNNRRRILVKNVPKFIPQKELKKYLERRFGPIEEFYHLLPFDSSKAATNKSKVCYSVMFQNSIQETIKGPIELEIRPNTTVIAEKFLVQKKKKPLCILNYHSQCHFQNLKTENYIHPSTCRAKHMEKPHHSILKNQLRISQSVDNEPIRKLKRRSSQTRSLSVGQRSQFANGYSRSVFIQDLINLCHHFKPNLKVYRLLRGEYSEYLAIFELKNTWLGLTNYRENLERLETALLTRK